MKYFQCLCQSGRCLKRETKLTYLIINILTVFRLGPTRDPNILAHFINSKVIKQWIHAMTDVSIGSNEDEDCMEIIDAGKVVEIGVYDQGKEREFFAALTNRR